MAVVTVREEDPNGEKECTKVEDILEAIGGYSTYQKYMTFALTCPQFVTAMIVLSPVFTGSSKVPLYCHKDQYVHDSGNCNVNCTVPPEDVTFSSIVQEWDLYCGKGWIVELITSFQMAGMTTGAMVSSIISDQFGRKKCFVFQTLCMGLLGMLPSLAFDPWSYAIARFFTGFGVGACFVIYLSHLMEFLTPAWRTICGTISFWPFGEMFLGLLAYWIGSWRWLIVATAAPALLILCFSKMVLESPRWLLVRKKTAETHAIFSTIAKWNGTEPPSMKSVEQLQAYVIKEESSSIHGIRAIKMIIANSTLRKHMGILVLANLTCAMVYYGVTFNAKNLSGNPYWNIFLMGVFDLFASPAALIFNNWIGRRKTFMLYMSLGTIFIVALLLVDIFVGIKETSPMIITTLSFCGRFGIVAAWGALTCIILETAPTNIRSTCLGFCAFVGYLGGILAPQLFLLSSIAEALPYFILCILTTSSSISSWFLKETLQQPLEDTVAKDAKPNRS